MLWIARYTTFIPEVPSRLFSNPLYYILFLSNFLIERHYDWTDVLSPFWSLAVEEQFYIIWPIPILAVKEIYLKNVIIATILLGIFSRVIFTHFGLTEGVLMPTCLDSFGFGALWALTLFYNHSPTQFIKKLGFWALPAFALFVFFSVDKANMMIKTMFFRTSMSICCLFFVARATYNKGFINIFGRLLDNQPLTYIGKISYGLYVFHMLVPVLIFPLLLKILNRLTGLGWHANEYTWKIACFVILVMWASVSYYIFETPINRLKKLFPYK